MTHIGCETTEDYLQLTHTASINDTFYEKAENEDVTWNNISLYKNEFSDVVSKLAFEGVGLYNVNFPSTSPEFTCEGSYRKCFRKSSDLGQYNSDIYIYKRGGKYNNNFEVYSEILSSEIAQIISPYNSVNYDLVELHGKIASKCNVFSNEKYGFVSYAQICNDSAKNLKDIVRYFSSIGSEQQLRELLVIDALCFNTDRHLGNFGVLFDNDTLSVVSISPVFDFNLSLLYSCNTKELKNQIGDCLYNFAPALYSDFTRMGQLGANGNVKIQFLILPNLPNHHATFQVLNSDISRASGYYIGRGSCRTFPSSQNVLQDNSATLRLLSSETVHYSGNMQLC